MLGLPIASIAVATLIGAYRLVRDLRAEPIYRIAITIALVLGILQSLVLAITIVIDLSAETALDQAGIPPSPPNYPFGFMLGALCLGTLWLIHMRLRPHD